MSITEGSKTGGANRLAMFLLGATLALGFALGAYQVANALVKMKQQSLIRVKGVGQTKIKSNFATWSCNFSVRADKSTEGYVQLEKSRDAVMRFLKEAGVAPSEMNANAASIETLYKGDEKGNKTNAIDGYRLNQNVSVWSGDVDKISRVSSSVSELLKTGVELQSLVPSYVYADIDSVKLDLLGKATKNAYERAQAMAANANGKVGKLNSASQGVFQVTPVNSTEVSDEGIYDTSSIDKSVKCVVTLEFCVDK